MTSQLRDCSKICSCGSELYKLYTKCIFPIFYILKINRMTVFCNLFILVVLVVVTKELKWKVTTLLYDRLLLYICCIGAGLFSGTYVEVLGCKAGDRETEDGSR